MSLPYVATDLHPDQERKHRTLIAQATNELIKVRPPNDKTEAEVAAGIGTLDTRYTTIDIRRYGAGPGKTQAENKAALQTAIDALNNDPTGRGGMILVPGDCSYGYVYNNPATFPDFTGVIVPIQVYDYSLGNSFSGYPTIYDGTQEKVFYFTPQTIATGTFTAIVAGGATSATLTTNWTSLGGRWVVTFSNGDVRNVTFTLGNTTATWTGGLSSGATATFTYINPGIHNGNTQYFRGAWNPGILISSDANLNPVGDPSRLALDNYRAQLSFGVNGAEAWKVGQGVLVGPGYTAEELSDFAIQKIAIPGDTLGSFGSFIVQRKTGNCSYGFGTTIPGASHHFVSTSAGYYIALFENIFAADSSILLRSNTGATDDCGIANTSGTLSLFIKSLGDALTIEKTKRRVTISTTLVLHSTGVSYSASITWDASDGNIFEIVATNGTAFTINAPTNAVAGMLATVTIKNTSGGALGAVTWNAVFKLAAWTQPANGFSRSITYKFNNTNWVEVSRTPADVPN